MSAYAVYLILSFAMALFLSTIFTVSLLYQVSVVGLDALQLVLVGTALEVTVFVCEIPTGVLADVKSRKLSIVIGIALIGVGFIIEGSLPSFGAVVLGQMLWGLGHTFTSGATQAWIVDEIGEQQASAAFVRGAQMNQLGGFVGIPLSVVLGLVAVPVPIVAGGVALVLLAVFCWVYMPEEGFKPVPLTAQRSWISLRDTLEQARSLVARQRVLLPMLGIALCYGLYSEGIDRLWPLLVVNDIGLPMASEPVVWFGLIYAVGHVLSLMATEGVRRWLDIGADRLVLRALMLFAVGMVAAIVGIALADGFWLAIVAFWIFRMLQSTTDPLYDICINRRIDDSRVRATMFSLAGQLNAIGQVGGGPGVGAVGRWWSIRVALLCSALLLMPVLPLYAWTQRIIKREGG